jgi:DNA-binding LacI/PurR family transcriptional regulator
MLLTIDKKNINLSSPKAKHLLLREAIKRQLAASADNGCGEIKLPSIPSLVKELKLSTTTVRRAFDDLTNEGLLYSIQGKGTYARGYNKVDKERAISQIGFAYHLRNETIALFDFIQNYALEQNCLLTSYNVSEDNQDPVKERIFLEQLEKKNFQGAIIMPTPIKPTNRELYRRMRENGIKVALVTPYAEHMDDEATFFEDYYHAGYMATAKMGMAGFKKISFASMKPFPVASRWFKNGVTQAANDLGLELLKDLIPEINMDVKSLPPGTGIISTHTYIGYIIYDLLAEAGRKPGEDIALCTRHDYDRPGYPPISYLISPQKELFKAAMDYILDPGIESTSIVHKTFKFKYEEHGTVVKK